MSQVIVEIEIDGKKVEVQEGNMLMDAANKLKIYIPHFCYHKKLSIAANCRMCLVEVENVTKPLPACATPIISGMIVHTNSDKAIKAQKGVMEFLLINHPLDCPICDQGGECQLQDLAVGYGNSSSRYLEEKRIVSSKNIGPLISMQEMNRCIHCTRCVRFGQEIAGIMELGMSGRGENSEITTFIGNTVSSELSGNMIDLCPVGALTSKPFRYSARTWELSRRKSISPHDSLGSNLIIQVKKDKVMRILPLVNEEINECWISDKDRFSYEGLNSEERLTKPMLKENGKWCEVKWQVALEYIVYSLRNIEHKYGANSIAALGTPYCTLEELFLLQKVMRGIGSNNIDFRLRQSDFTLDHQINPWLGMSITDFSQLNCIFIIGSFLRKDHPLLAIRLRQALKNGAKFSLLHATNDDLLMPISTKIIQAPSTWLVTLNEIIAAIAQLKNINAPDHVTQIQISSKAREIATNLVVNQQSKAILLGNAVAQHPQASKLHIAAQWIAENTNAKFGYLIEGCNTVGGYLTNALPTNGGANALQVFTKPRKAYLLLNAEPELDSYNPFVARNALIQAEIVIIMSAYQRSIDYANVLLPIAPFTETSGTFINCEGRVQSFNNAVKPLGDTKPAWKVLRILGNLLGLTNFDYDTSEAIRNQVLNHETNIAKRLNNLTKLIPKNEMNVINNTLERVADVPIYSTDAIVRHSSALLKTLDAQPPKAWLPEELAIKLEITNGDLVCVKQEYSDVVLIAAIDKTLPKNVIRISTAHVNTANLGGMFDSIFIKKYNKSINK